ncbi:MAG: TcmI family type II polyketide cyclase [Streptosporangiaceae bacterium]|nr:TcmI family type II polyketide cyclase [Streptosporangiaceae bacterium]
MPLHQTLMIRKIDPRDVAEVTRIFTHTDQETALPRRIGVRRRDLFEYQGICLHLVQSDEDFIQRLREEKDAADFRELDQALRKYMTPYAPDALGIELLKPFYTWNRD